MKLKAKSKKFLKTEELRRQIVSEFLIEVTHVALCTTHTTQCYYGIRDGYNIAVLFNGTLSINPVIFDFSIAEQKVKIESIFKLNYEKNREYPRTLKVNDLLYYSWGYEQTNINFFQIVALSGEKSVILREVNKNITAPNLEMTGTATPILNDFKGEQFRKKVCTDGCSVQMDYSVASLLNEKSSKFFTTYG